MKSAKITSALLFFILVVGVKESGVGTYEKSMSLLGIPVGTVGIGSCVDY